MFQFKLEIFQKNLEIFNEILENFNQVVKMLYLPSEIFMIGFGRM
jgi:hypothetical protein